MGFRMVDRYDSLEETSPTTVWLAKDEEDALKRVKALLEDQRMGEILSLTITPDPKIKTSGLD